MSVWKALLLTLLFIILAEVSFAWLLLGSIFELPLWFFDHLYLIASGFQLLVVGLFLYFQNRKKGLHFGKTPAYYYPYAFILGVAYVFAQIPLNTVYYWLFGYYRNIQFSFDPEMLSTTFFWTVVILVPIVEELFFRGHIQRRLQFRYPVIVAILVSASLFALIHLNLFAAFYNMDYLNPHHVYITFFGGLISGTFYYLSKSVGPSILFHMAWNLMATLF